MSKKLDSIPKIGYSTATTIRGHIVTIGERIKEERIKAGLGQVELARAAGIRQAAMCEIEQGKVDPRWVHIIKLCGALEIKPEKLVKGVTIEGENNSENRK